MLSSDSGDNDAAQRPLSPASGPRPRSSGEHSPAIPEIAVFGSTESLGRHNEAEHPLSPAPSSASPTRDHSPSSARDWAPGADLLSLPNSGGGGGSGRTSFDSTSPFDQLDSPQSDSGPYLPPPSPALSAVSSVHFAPSTLQLRQNKPHESDGLSSLNLLAAPTPGHRRRGSSATIASSLTGSETVADHDIAMSPRSDAGSIIGSPTHTHVDDDDDYTNSRSPSRSPSRSSFGKKLHRLKRSTTSPSITSDTHSGDDNDSAKRKRKDKQPAELARPERVELAKEADFDPAPFAFKPLRLANLVDPKSIEALEELGGVEGLLRGLGTHRSGLGSGPDDAGSDTGSEHSVSRRKSSHEEIPRPDITLTVPEGEDNAMPNLPSHSQTSIGAGNVDYAAAFAASIEDRKRVFGENVLPVRHAKSLWRLMWGALTDKVLILLSIAAVVSLALGFFQDFGPARDPNQPPVDWVEGVAIIVAIMVVVLVGSINDWQKERQFQVLNAKKEERMVKVIRGGVERQINVHDVVVGDIALLEPGEVIPCDGVFLSGNNVRCDESGATGESDAIKKLSYEECIAMRDAKLRDYSPSSSPAASDPAVSDKDDGQDKKNGRRPSGMDLLGHTDCFVISGSKVLEGVGKYVVISVGTRSFNGRIMMALRGDAEDTPLQLKLNSLANTIAWAGMIVGIMLFTGLMIRFFVEIGTGNPPMSPSKKGITFVNILIISVTLVVVAVPEGLPLAVTLALAFATKRMTRENLLVRVLGSCETMANASVVCTDKTGTLTQNEMTVVAGSIGIHAKFVRDLNQNQARADVGEASKPKKSSATRKHAHDFALELTDVDKVCSPALRKLLNESVAINSTAFEDTDQVSGARVFVGSKTETALLKMAKELSWPNYKTTRDSAHVIQAIPFSSERKAMGIVVRIPNGRARLYIKGASEILTAKCTRHVVVHRNAEDAPKSEDDELETDSLSDLDNDNIARTIQFYASQTLRTIALCYRDFESWPPAGVETGDDGEVPYATLAQEMTLIAITGIEDPLRPGVRDAVTDCARAGVQVKMCTGDNVLTARSIAQQCGIYTPGGIVMEGPHFRALPENIRRQIVPRLQVLARSSPEDKRILVDTLKELGEVVGVTGDGTNDGPALKTANVGFSMGIAGTEVAKEASDIILMDDNFASIVKAIMWGRAVNDAVRKFLQFQISTNVTAVIITLVSGIASANTESVLSAVQLLWINIIMDTFAALALATDPASTSSLDRRPDKKWAPLFSVDMIKQIIGQSLYQTVIILVFHFVGGKILGFESNHDLRVTTLVFNAFVFAQIFNSFNCRRLDRRLNIFEGMLQNWYFICITFIEVGAQVLIVFVGGAAFTVTRIGGREWGISIALGIVSIPLGALIRMIPNGPCERLFKAVRLIRDPPILPTTRDDPEPGLNFAFDMLQSNLGAFRRVRGGRLRASSFNMKSMTNVVRRRDEGVVPGLLTMLPSLVGAHIVGSNWTPADGSLSDPAGFDPSKSSAALWENKFEVHPQTSPDDPIYKLLNGPSSSRQKRIEEPSAAKSP